LQEADDGLIKKAQKGDKQAFEQVIRIYKQFVANLCYRNLGNREDAVDMAQDVFCEIYTSIGSYRFQSKFSTWLYRLVFFQCANRIKSLARGRRVIDTGTVLEGEEGEYERQLPDTSKTAEENIVSEEMRMIVIDGLNKLPEAEKQAYVLRELQELDYVEISEIMKIPLGSVKSKLNSARKKLKQILIRKLKI
jgi:RNA polymerase sigma-70 factor, ECF subfamily